MFEFAVVMLDAPPILTNRTSSLMGVPATKWPIVQVSCRTGRFVMGPGSLFMDS